MECHSKLERNVSDMVRRISVFCRTSILQSILRDISDPNLSFHQPWKGKTWLQLDLQTGLYTFFSGFIIFCSVRLTPKKQYVGLPLRDSIQSGLLQRKSNSGCYLSDLGNMKCDLKVYMLSHLVLGIIFTCTGTLDSYNLIRATRRLF